MALDSGIRCVHREQGWNRLEALGEETAQQETDHEQQGPRAKYMLYPYYALLISTTAGKKGPKTTLNGSGETDTISSIPIHDDPHGSRPQDLVRLLIDQTSNACQNDLERRGRRAAGLWS